MFSSLHFSIICTLILHVTILQPVTPSHPHSLIPSLPHPLTPSLPHSLTPSSLTSSPPQSLTPSLPHPLTLSSLTSSPPHSLTPSLPHFLTSSLPYPSLPHILNPSLPHSLTPSQGLANNKVRREIWRYLLNYYPFDVTEIERMEIRRNKEKEYWTMKQQWQSFTQEQENRFTKWREAKVIISEFHFIT